MKTAHAHGSHPRAIETWGAGQLLAFSALDGATDYAHGLCARTTAAGGCGLSVMLPGRAELRFAEQPPLRARLTGDSLELHVAAGAVRAVLLDAHHLLVDGPCRVLSCGKGLEALSRGARTLVGSAARFSPALIEADVGQAIRDRVRWLEAAPLPAGLAPARRRMLLKALSVMKTQVCSPEGRFRRPWTTPDRWPHRCLFLWDSVFHAIGWRHVDPVVARNAIEAVLDVMDDEGFVPHMNRPERSSNMTQPPVLAFGAVLVDRIAPDPAWLGRLYPGLCRYLAWDLAHRDSDGAGLLEWFIEEHPGCRCGESGMDNSPRFDCALALDATDFNAFAALECEMLAFVATKLGQPGEAERWSAEHARLCRLINERLWDDRLGFYVDCEAATGRRTGILASSGFLPLICGAPSPEQARRLASHLEDPSTFGTPFPVPSLAACEPAYQKDMWRGPVWINTNWLVAFGLERYGLVAQAANLRERTLAELARHSDALGSLFEFYDDRAKVPPPQLLRKGRLVPGVAPHEVIFDYGWTATLAADWIYSTAGGAACA